jgi:DNA-binding response OmpR family regulator
VASLLLIEDDPGIRATLARALAERGHAVEAADGGMAGLERALESGPDLVLLDLGLPDLDGVTVLSMLRAVATTPVVVITARDDESQILAALDAGADDYVAKPFGPDHLDARIRAVLRRTSAEQPQGPLVVGGLSIDVKGHAVAVDGAPVTLTPKEFDLLLALAQRAGELVTKRELFAEVWRQPYGGGDRTVDVHLSWLRRKLGETAERPRFLHSVRGVGVRLDDDGPRPPATARP